MHRSVVLIGTALALPGCHSYEPAPVDLRAWAQEFGARLEAVRAAASDPATPDPAVPDDGIDRREGRDLALWLHPECRLARSHAGVARVARDEAGRWPDPQLGIDLERILETVAHPWLAAGDLGITVPLSGRLASSKELARELHGVALAEALVVESDVQNRVDLAFARWSAARERVALLTSLTGQLRDLESIAARLAEAQELTHPAARVFTLERVQRAGELALAETAVAAGELECKRMVGLPPDAAVQFEPSLDVDEHTPDRTARREQLFGNPRLLLLRARHAAAERALALAVDQQWPDLVLRPGFAEEDAQPRVTLGFVLPLPLWSGNTAAIHEAEARRAHAAEALRAGYEERVQDLAAAELRVTGSARHRAFVESELLPLAAEQVADCRRLAELGQLEPLLILDALVRDHTARLLAIDARLQQAEATVAQNALSALPLPADALAEENR